MDHVIVNKNLRYISENKGQKFRIETAQFFCKGYDEIKLDDD